jgi:hypothetical protein
MTVAERTPKRPLWLKAGLVTATLWSATLLFLLWRRADSIVAEALSFASMIAAIVAGSWQFRFPSLSQRMTKGAVVVFLAADLIVTAVWLGRTVHDNIRPIDVTANVDLRNHVGIVHGTHAESDVPVLATRRAIAIAFDIADHHPEQGVCAPYATLKVTAVTGSHQSQTATAKSGELITLAYPPSTDRLRLDILLVNDRDHNCAMDLSVASARLVND